MSDIILHHYPPSPVAEKIRTAFGLKRLGWRSVEENRMPDRPELFAMTGGYRRIPVMQVGADIYCDTQLIFMELERRHPEPSLFPGGRRGLPFGLSRWLDGECFELGVRAAFAPALDRVPEALLKDRTRLYFGPDVDMEREREDMPHTLAQLRAQLGWLDTALSASGNDWFAGDAAGMPDLLVWYVYWFVRGRYPEAASFLAEFSGLDAWATRAEAIGHGDPSDMSPAEALAVAADTEPATEESGDPLDPQGLEPGQRISVAPMVRNDMERPVDGVIRQVSRDRIAISRRDDRCGEVVVHFPRVGYRVTPAH